MRTLLEATRVIRKELQGKEVIVLQQSNMTRDRVEYYADMFLDRSAREWVVEEGTSFYTPITGSKEHQISINTIVDAALSICCDKIFDDMLDNEPIYEAPTFTVTIEAGTSDTRIISIIEI